jgi:HK97 family phage portal protein
MPLFTDAVSNLRNRGVPPRVDPWWPVTPITAGSVGLSGGLSASYRDIYRSQPWVYAAVNIIARAMMRMPLKGYSRNADGERERVQTGPLAQLARRPAPGIPWSRYADRLAKNVAIYGNHIVVKMGMDDEAGTPTELIPAPPVGWELGAGSTYIWTAPNGDRYPFDRWRILHYCFWDLDENGFGMSPLEPLRRTLAVEDAAQRYGVAAFANGARPSSVLSTDQTIKGDDNLKRLKTELQTLHGGVDNAFKLAVLQFGLKWESPPQSNLEDAALIGHRELTQDEVAAAYQIPQPMLGILRNANFASIDMLHTILYQDSLGPWAVMIEDTTQAELVEVTPAFDGQFVEIDMNGVMRGDLLSRVRAYSTMIQTGQKTMNEVRSLENDPPSDQPEADQLLIPKNLAGATGAVSAVDQGASATLPAPNGKVPANV